MTRQEIETPEVLSGLLRYCPASGELYWLPRSPEMASSDRAQKSFNIRDAGTKAGCFHAASGYVQVRVCGVLLSAHRIAYVLGSGEAIPAGMKIDHVNGERCDNRYSNLRIVDSVGNGQNRRPRPHRELARGVVFDKARGMYRAEVRVNGKSFHAGRFRDPDAAASAARAKRQELGFLDG
jgi:hypothetical protein